MKLDTLSELNNRILPIMTNIETNVTMTNVNT